MAKTKAVAVKEEKTSALAVGFEFEEESTGLEELSSNDYKIPFIKVLQALSPEVKSVAKGGVEGAEEGMIYFSDVGAFSGEEGLEIIPCYFEKVFTEWKPDRGGFVGFHDDNSDFIAQLVAKNGKSRWGLTTKDGNDLIETKNIYVLVVKDGEVLGRGIISCTSTKINAFRELVSKLRIKDKKGNPIPIFAYRFKVQTIEKSSDKGDYYSIRFVPAEKDLANSVLSPQSDEYLLAKDFHKLVKEGKAQIDYEANQDTESASGIDEEIPF
jgi:hypothetical protein